MQPTALERYQEKPFIGSSHHWAEQICLELPKDSSVLDVGSGSGTMGAFLKEHEINEVWAIEVDSAAIERAEQIYDKVLTDITQVGEKQFDLILFMDVLEHMTDPFSYLEASLKYLKPGGRVLISVPNIAHWSVRIPLLFGFFQYTNRGILDRTHFQFFTRSRFRDLLRSSSQLKIEKLGASIEPAEFVLPKWIWDNALFRICCSIRVAFARLLPGLMAYQHLGVASKVN